MTKININNATPEQERLIRAVCKYSLQALHLSRKKLTIQFNLLERQDCHGEIEQIGDREYSIDVAVNYKTIKDFVGTIAHELTHIDQWLSSDEDEDDEREEEEADVVAEWVCETMWEENLI